MTNTYIQIGNVYYLEEDFHKVLKPRIKHLTEKPDGTIKEFGSNKVKKKVKKVKS